MSVHKRLPISRMRDQKGLVIPPVRLLRRVLWSCIG